MERIFRDFPGQLETAVCKSLTSDWQRERRHRMARVADAGIVSLSAVPYTRRERISWNLWSEGAHICKPKLCMNQPEED
jgi:hypothetical protein